MCNYFPCFCKKKESLCNWNDKINLTTEWNEKDGDDIGGYYVYRYDVRLLYGEEGRSLAEEDRRNGGRYHEGDDDYDDDYDEGYDE